MTSGAVRTGRRVAKPVARRLKAVPAARWVALAAALAVLAFLASGCSSGGRGTDALQGRSSGPPPSVTPSATHIRQYLPHPARTKQARPGPPATPRPATVPPATGGTGGSGSQPVAAGPVACPAAGLRITVGAPSGAAGSLYYALHFTNIGVSACTMYGYPGVALVSADGGLVVGEPAVRDPAAALGVVTLTPRGTASAVLQVQEAASYPASECKPVRAHWLQVYPPGSYVASYLPFSAVTCTGRIPSGSTLGINVITPGASGR